jgi:uncharacterized protein (TIGR03435 family)
MSSGRTLGLIFGISTVLPYWTLAQEGKVAPQAQPTFEVVSIKPCRNWTGENGSGRVEASGTRFMVQCHSVDEMIRDAYRLYARGMPWRTNPLTRTLVLPMSPAMMYAPVQGSTGWMKSEHYIIAARADRPASVEMMRGPMMQRVLEERFRLRLRRDRNEVKVFDLVVAKGANPKLQEAKLGTCYALQPDKGPPTGAQPICGGFRRALRGGIDIGSVTMGELCMLLSTNAGRDVIDKTGIVGVFDLHLDVSLDQLRFVGTDDPAEGAAALVSALKKIGLALQPGKVLFESLTIEHVERPTEN